ncbi:MAG TPA: DUF4157 domain-containing protein [Acidobacteriota bacterium]|nr:DUF4157 domain-containing protein [Acidobacteriota bacterium]
MIGSAADSASRGGLITRRTDTAETRPDELDSPSGAATLLVDDDFEPGPLQMRKGEFLNQLESSVTEAAEGVMAGTEHSTKGCPYLAFWFSYYRAKNPRHIERALRRYVPEAEQVQSAAERIPLVVERVRRAVQAWVQTGEITGLPESLPLGVPAAMVRPRPSSSSGASRRASNPVYFKARLGGPRPAQDPDGLLQQLGPGRPLESASRSRMESAFGSDFSRVRVHSDAQAGRLSGSLNARAFTVGRHVAFGAGQYRPGTPLGDALIAHELAHVTQQEGGQGEAAPMTAGAAAYEALEADADRSAMAVVGALWRGSKGALAEVRENAAPRLRSGLRLQRCGVFSEWSAEKYQGYDSSPDPEGLVVPVGGKRKVAVDDPDKKLTIESQDTSIATVDATTPAGGMTVQGIKHDKTKITAKEGEDLKDQLDVSVKRKITKTVDYHYMSDNAGHSTKRKPGDEVALNNKLNEIWERQANIHFKVNKVDSQQVPQDLGDIVIAARGTDPAAQAISKFSTSGDYNVFLVWEFETGGTMGEDITQGGTTGGMTILEDDTVSDLAFPHEAGHFLGLVQSHEHPTRGIMANINGGISPRVYKEDADKVNP